MNINNELFKFIKSSPSPYHTVESVKAELLGDGYSELYEADRWNLTDGGKYFVIRNGTSIIAFESKKSSNGFMIAASHSDSPSFRIKITPELSSAYTRLEVEKYGGMIYYSWLDRPLSVAGRAVIKTKSGIESRLVNIDRDLAVIPSVAIHMNRGVNDGYKFNPAVDLLPLVGSSDAKGALLREIANELKVSENDIISHDLFLYNRDEGKIFGANNEYIISPRLDDLECVFASLKAFLSASDSKSTPVLAVFDNEEVGSETKQGAASTFLHDVLLRIAGEDYYTMLDNSFMVSADNAHAKHPNHPELADADNAPLMNSGIVIKWNANQKYATDGVSDAFFRTVCERCGAKVQSYYNRADMLGGSTLGSISNTKVSVPTVDIGLAQLAMHSANETAGAEDVQTMICALTEFFSTAIEKHGEKITF